MRSCGCSCRPCSRSLRSNLGDLALDLHGHRQRALYHAFAFAIRAVLVHRAGHAFTVALARHFHQAKLRDVQDAGLGFIAADAFAHLLRDLLLVVAVTHVDKVDHDQPADIAEAKLTTDFFGGFKIGLQNCCVEVLL